MGSWDRCHNRTYRENIRNFGPGKFISGPIKTNLKGKTLSMLTYTSPSGGITSEILIDMLTYMDKEALPDQTNNKLPVFILDGHTSQLAPEFVDYVTNPDHE